MAKFTRGHKLTAGLCAFAVIWLLLIFNVCCKSQFGQIIFAIPGYCIMIFGCYALFTIGKELAILKDYPDEHQSLLNEIKNAKDYYKTKGLSLSD